MRNRAVVVVVLALLFALATRVAGWWAIPLVAFVAGTRERDGASPLLVAVAAALAWGVLLAVAATAAPFGTLLGELAGIMRLPSSALVVLTLLFPALLAWSAAALGGAMAGRRPTNAVPAVGVSAGQLVSRSADELISR